MKEEYYTSVPYARPEFEQFKTEVKPNDKRINAKTDEG